MGQRTHILPGCLPGRLRHITPALRAAMSVIGVDLGGTKLALALFSDDGTVVVRRTAPLAGRRGEEVGELIATELRTLLATPEAAADAPAAIGIAVPGIYRSATGRVWAPNIPGWDDYPLRDEIIAALGAPAALTPGAGPLPSAPVVRVDSDRACAILGEAWCGTARGARDAIFIAVGTGIGAGILVNGAVVRGARDIAGAVGWLALDRQYRPGYSAMGCFEYHAAGPGLARAAAQLRGGTDEVTTAAVFEAYDAGDPVATRVIDDAVAIWGMAVANLVSTFDPEIVVFGGGVFGPAGRFLPRIRAEAERWAQPLSMPHVRLAVSSLGNDAVLFGAGHLALRAASPAATALSATPEAS
jgi:glucokinase